MDVNDLTNRKTHILATPDEIAVAGAVIDGVFDQAVGLSRKLARPKKNRRDGVPLVGFLERLRQIHTDMAHLQCQQSLAMDRAGVRVAVQSALGELAAEDKGQAEHEGC